MRTYHDFKSQKIKIREYPEPKEIEKTGFNNFIAFDLETTGFDRAKDSIVEIGAIKALMAK